MTDVRDLDLRTEHLPSWVRWMLDGILRGMPLTQAQITKYVVSEVPCEKLTDVLENARITNHLDSLRLGEGCYGLAAGSNFKFSANLTIIFGKNGSGKSSLIRVLRAISGRPSLERPPSNILVRPPIVAEAFVKSAGNEEIHWRADASESPLHFDVLDSADTAADGTEYQIRPRKLLALEQLRVSLDSLVFSEPRWEMPSSFAAILTRLSEALPSDWQSREELCTKWATLGTRSLRPLDVIISEELEHSAPQLSKQLHDSKSRQTELESVQKKLTEITSILGEAIKLLEAEEFPAEIISAEFDGFYQLYQLLERWLVETDPELCLVCGAALRAQRETVIAQIQRAKSTVENLISTKLLAVKNRLKNLIATDSGSPDDNLRTRVGAVLEALEDRQLEALRVLTTENSAAEKVVLAELEVLGKQQSELSNSLADLKATTERLETERKNAQIKQYVTDFPSDFGEVRDMVRAGHRIFKAQTSLKSSLKTRLTTISKNLTAQVLDGPHSKALERRLYEFNVPHFKETSVQHIGRQGRGLRRYVSAGKNARDWFSEGQLRSLALADFAAELDGRVDELFPVVLDDPTNSLDSDNTEIVTSYIRELVYSGRQVIVATHNMPFLHSLIRLRGEARSEGYICSAYQLVDESEHYGSVRMIEKKGLADVAEWEERIEAQMTILRAHAAVEPLGIASEDQVLNGYSLIRSWCEAVIEEQILKGVVQRLDVQVSPSKMDYITPEVLAAGQRVADIHRRCHRLIPAHHQPVELRMINPEVSGVEKMWKAAQAAAQVEKTKK